MTEICHGGEEGQAGRGPGPSVAREPSETLTSIELDHKVATVASVPWLSFLFRHFLLFLLTPTVLILGFI